MKFNTGRTIRLSVLASAIALTLSASPALAQDNTTGLLKGTISTQNGNQLADDYLVMERGEVIARGPGSEMEAKGIRNLVAI